jgi:hypothetical protein
MATFQPNTKEEGRKGQWDSAAPSERNFLEAAILDKTTYSLSHTQLQGMLRLVVFIPGSYVSLKSGDSKTESVHIGVGN